MPHEGLQITRQSYGDMNPTTLNVPQPDHAGELGGELNSAVARAVVRVHRWHAGRGPTRARAFFRHDVVVAVLQDALTVTERSLIADDRRNAVAQLRSELNAAMRPSLAHSVEALTACRVIACTSDTDIEAGTSAVVFVLDRPVDLDEAHRAIERLRLGRGTAPAPPD
jgi:uncharacterized protein YbcI